MNVYDYDEYGDETLGLGESTRPYEEYLEEKRSDIIRCYKVYNSYDIDDPYSVGVIAEYEAQKRVNEEANRRYWEERRAKRREYYAKSLKKDYEEDIEIYKKEFEQSDSVSERKTLKKKIKKYKKKLKRLLKFEKDYPCITLKVNDWKNNTFKYKLYTFWLDKGYLTDNQIKSCKKCNYGYCLSVRKAQITELKMLVLFENKELDGETIDILIKDLSFNEQVNFLNRLLEEN